ncbi:MAG: hemerythrin family protein [Nitrospirae bacterium]|nr:hemerythrin family protein [Nitrospirota bacterium]
MIEWQTDMTVGIEEFDTHHKRIIALINKLHASLKAGEGREVTGEVLTELVNYTVYHFFAEEAFMEKYNYPEYAQHRTEHLNLTSKTLDLLEDLNKNNKNVGPEVLEFLVNWLKNHIMVTDKKFQPFVQRQGIPT